MCSIETIDVIACLEIVCQAFRDGGAIVEKVKNKRAQKKAPPPPRLLEESIDAAPGEIKKEKDQGVLHFGKAFEDGDHISIITLQHVALQLQATFLEKLKNTAFDDDSKTTDFTYLVAATDTARDRTIAALHDLQQRLLNINKTPKLDHEPDTFGSATAAHERPAVSLRSSTEHSPPPIASEAAWGQSKHKTWTRDFSIADDESVSGAEDPRHAHHRKRSSFLHFLKHHRTVSGSDKYLPQPTVPEEVPSRHASIATADIPIRPAVSNDTNDVARHRDSFALTNSNITYQDWDDNHSPELWNAKHSLDRRDTFSTAFDALSSFHSRSLSIDATSTAATPRSSSNPHNQSIGIPVPTPDNDYLGFCKSAWRLQNGDRSKSFTKCREAEAWSRVPSAQTQKQYLACAQPKCAFRSHISNANPDAVWDQVFSKASLGIKFRWRFLAKSHVLQRVVVKGSYTFKCLFCICHGTGVGSYQGIDPLLEHIAGAHRGQKIGQVILYRAGCINDHVAGVDEEYDINLLPLSTEEQQSRQKVPEVVTDEIVDPTQDANDSMFTAEPWNEGLSDFHQHDVDYESISLD